MKNRKVEILISIILSLVALEIILRISIQFIPTKNAVTLKEIYTWHSQGKNIGITEAASYVRLKNTKNNKFLEHNSKGFHSPEIDFSDTSRFRIIFMGSSTTYDKGEIKETYPYMVCNFLDSLKFRIDYINAGVPGYTSTENLFLYHLALRKLKPDLIVIYLGRNDIYTSGNTYFQDELINMRTRRDKIIPSNTHMFFSKLSISYAIISEYLGIYKYQDKVIRSQIGVPDKMDTYIKNIMTGKALKVYEENLNALAILTKNDNVKLLLVGQDFYQKKCRSSAFPTDRSLYESEKDLLNKFILEIGRINERIAKNYKHVYYFNLYNKICRSYFSDDSHLNYQGKKQKANFIGEYISKNYKKLGLKVIK